MSEDLKEASKEPEKEVKTRNTDKKRIESLEQSVIELTDKVVELNHFIGVIKKAVRISPDLFKRRVNGKTIL